MEWVGFAASIVMGIILGVMGGGGSILTVPILVYLFGISPTISTGYSLFVVGSTALIGSIAYIRKGDVELRSGLLFAVLSVTGVNLSRGWIIPKLPLVVIQNSFFTLTKEVLVMMIFALLMVVASYSMIVRKNSEKTQLEARPRLRISFIAFIGLIVGVIAGFIGAGGGFLIIPALVFIAGLSMRVAVGTSLLIIALQSLLGFVTDLSRGLPVEWSMLGAVTGFAIIGIVIGSAFSKNIQEQKLKVYFGWFVLVMGISILLEQLRHLSI